MYTQSKDIWRCEWKFVLHRQWTMWKSYMRKCTTKHDIDDPRLHIIPLNHDPMFVANMNVFFTIALAENRLCFRLNSYVHISFKNAIAESSIPNLNPKKLLNLCRGKHCHYFIWVTSQPACVIFSNLLGWCLIFSNLWQLWGSNPRPCGLAP